MIERPVGDEVVVYDPATHKAHCLNRTAAVVFRAADGRASIADLVRRLEAETGAQADESVVRAALAAFDAAGLLEATLPPPEAFPSRREALRRVGLGAAVLAPVVVSLVVPTPAEALNTCIPAAACSTTNAGQPCWVSSQAVECVSKMCDGVNVGVTGCN